MELTPRLLLNPGRGEPKQSTVVKIEGTSTVTDDAPTGIVALTTAPAPKHSTLTGSSTKPLTGKSRPDEPSVKRTVSGTAVALVKVRKRQPHTQKSGRKPLM